VDGRVVQLLSDGNNTFHHLGKTGSEQKLTNFQEAQTIVPRPALRAVGAGDCSHTSSLWDHLRKSACTNDPSHQKKPGFNHPELIFSKDAQ
jgi:hypothetical protein